MTPPLGDLMAGGHAERRHIDSDDNAPTEAFPEVVQPPQAAAPPGGNVDAAPLATFDIETLRDDGMFRTRHPDHAQAMDQPSSGWSHAV